MPRPKRTKERRRLNLDLTEQTRERLDRLRIQTEADSLTEVIRRALTVYEALLERSENHIVSIRLPDKTIEKILLT
ncbi:MAG: ribbon-helix-helix protein, CopG family [Candidatus Uhrbacteria bacterium]|nr:ribbon-helix-helix protein, CopG family [Candidatus Uhrbacteria bacterium]